MYPIEMSHYLKFELSLFVNLIRSVGNKQTNACDSSSRHCYESGN
jgi:hypothetical protein